MAATATSPASWLDEFSRRGSRLGGWAAKKVQPVLGVVSRRESHNNHMTNTTSKTQTQPQPLCAEQRKGMAHLLADMKERADNELESSYALDQRIKAELLPKLAKDCGAISAIKKVERLRKQLKEAETTLGKLGFQCDEDADLSLTKNVPKAVSQALEKAQRSARNERNAQLLTYDKAILKVWAVQDADELEKIVEGLL